MYSVTYMAALLCVQCSVYGSHKGVCMCVCVFVQCCVYDSLYVCTVLCCRALHLCTVFGMWQVMCPYSVVYMAAGVLILCLCVCAMLHLCLYHEKIKPVVCARNYSTFV